MRRHLYLLPGARRLLLGAAHSALRCVLAAGAADAAQTQACVALTAQSLPSLNQTLQVLSGT